MRLLDERAQVRDVAARWKGQYYDVYKRTWYTWENHPESRAEDIYKRLLALDVETATASDVQAAMGIKGWVSPDECHECGKESWQLVQLGQEPGYESSTASICRDCLLKALSLTSPPITAADQACKP